MRNSWRSLRALAARRPELAVRVGYNGLAQLAPIVVVLALTPLLLTRLGLDRFGIWSLALVVLNTLRLLDGGIAASLARFFAAHAAHDDRAGAGRLLVGALLALALLGGLLTLAAFPLAPSIVDLLNVPQGLHEEAAVVLRWVPALSALALMGESTSALLVGNGRFRALAGTMWTAAGVFAVAVVVLVDHDAHLQVLLVAAGLRYGVLIAANLTMGARHVSLTRPLLPSMADAREVAAYSSRMQLTALTGFVNTELDALVIAAVLPVRYVGLYQIGMQVASAVRSLPLFAFPPLLTRLTTIFRLEGRERTADEFRRLERRWLPGVLAFGIVGVAAVGFAVPAWLGDRYWISGGAAAILLAGYTIHVGLTGMRTCYVRAVGRPGLETRCSAVWTVGNALITVPLALAGGLLGVVAATAATGMIASVYFVWLCRREEGLPLIAPQASWWGLVAAAVVVAVAGEAALAYSDLHGFGALALAGLPALLAWGLVAGGMRRALGARPAAAT